MGLDSHEEGENGFEGRQAAKRIFHLRNRLDEPDFELLELSKKLIKYGIELSTIENRGGN